MPNYRTVFGSYLKAEDLIRPANVVIESVELRDMKGEHGTQRRLVASFHGKDKTLVLNRTNADTIAQIAGTFDFDEWRDVAIQLYRAKTRFGSRGDVPCIRVRAASAQGRPAARRAPVAAPPPDETWGSVDEGSEDGGPEPFAAGEPSDDDIPF